MKINFYPQSFEYAFEQYVFDKYIPTISVWGVGDIPHTQVAVMVMEQLEILKTVNLKAIHKYCEISTGHKLNQFHFSGIRFEIPDGKNMTTELIFDAGKTFGGFKPHVSIRNNGKRIHYCGVTM